MSDDRDAHMIRVEDLPGGQNAETFNGHEHGASVSMFLSHNRPGTGPELHRHPYEEIFVVREGEATFTVGDDEVAAQADDILVVPPETPHKFVNTGSERLRMTAIHHAPSFDTEWLE